MLLTLLGFLTEFSALGLPRVDYNQFAKSLEKKLLPNGKTLQFSLDLGLIVSYTHTDLSDEMGCCPTIVKQSSEISTSGCAVQVKIVINITPSGKESIRQATQNCTSEDHKFMYILTDCNACELVLNLCVADGQWTGEMVPRILAISGPLVVMLSTMHFLAQSLLPTE